MPKVEAGRISPGSGEIVYPETGTVNPLPTSATVSVAEKTMVLAVDGENLGFGSGLFAGSNGVEDVVLEFRSLLVGDGLTIEDGPNSITIRLTAGLIERFVDLIDTPDAIVPHGILYGDATGARVDFLPPPDLPDAVLRWNGTLLEWTVRNRGTVTFVSMEGRDGITVAGGPITTAGGFTVGLESLGVAGTYTAPTVVVDAQGRIRSAVSNVVGETNEGANLGGGAGLYAGKDGATLRFRSLRGSGAVAVQQMGNEVTVDLGASGVVPGTYSLPNVVVDTYGRITQAASRRLVGTLGVTVTETPGTILLSAPEPLLTVAVNNINVGQFSRLDFSGPLSVTQPSLGTARIVLNAAPVVSVSNLAGGSAGVFSDIQNGTARFRAISASGRATITQQGDAIVVGQNPQNIEIWENGTLAVPDVRKLEFGNFISVSQVPGEPTTTIEASFNPPFRDVVNIGTGVALSTTGGALPPNTLGLLSLTGGEGVTLSVQNDTIVISSPLLSIQQGTVVFPNVLTLTAGSNIVAATLAPGVVRLDFSIPPAQILAVTNTALGSGATLVRSVVNGTAQINRIVAGLGIRITEAAEALTIAGPSLVGSGGVTVNYNATLNQFLVSAPPPNSFNLLNGTGAVGNGAISGADYSVAVSGSNVFARRIRAQGGLTIRTGGVPTFGQDSELIIDATAYASLLNPTGVVAGTYSFPRVVVDALGRIVSAQTGVPPFWTVSNLGSASSGQAITSDGSLAPSATIVFRRIGAVAPLQVGSLSDRIVLSMADSAVIPGVYNNPSVQVDQRGLVQGIAGSAAIVTGVTAHTMSFQFTSGNVVSASAPAGWSATVVDNRTVRFTHNLGRIPASVFFSADRTNGSTPGVGEATNTFRTVDADAPPPGQTAGALAVGVDANSFTVYGATPARLGSDASGARGLVTAIVVI